MSLLSPSQTIVRYRVAKTEDEKIMETIRAALIKNAMPEIQSKYEEIMVGWVPFEKPYDPSFELHPFIYGTDFVFSLRIDKKTIPAKTLAQHIALAIQAKLKDTDRDFLSKNEKAEIKELVLDKLMSQVPFVPATYEVHWNYETGTIMFFSNNKTANEMFETMFLKSFDRPMYRLFPYTLAARDNADVLELITQLSPVKIGDASC